MKRTELLRRNFFIFFIGNNNGPKKWLLSIIEQMSYSAIHQKNVQKPQGDNGYQETSETVPVEDIVLMVLPGELGWKT